MNNSIFLRRKSKIFIEKSTHNLEHKYIFTLLKNIESLGFTLDEEVIKILETFSPEELKAFYKALVKDLNYMVGAYREFKPMYPNFPAQVMGAADIELYFTAAYHYLGDFLGKRLMPHFDVQQRQALRDVIKPQVIRLGTKEEFQKIFINLFKSKTSITPEDKQDIQWIIKNYGEGIKTILPEKIPFKENVAIISAVLLKQSNSFAVDFFSKNTQTTTDVLRIITALSDGDVSLTSNTKYKNIPRGMRKMFLEKLDTFQNLTEDLLRFEGKWKRVGEKLHPFEFKNKYKNVYDAFDVIRNNKLFSSFNREIESFILNKDFPSLLLLLKSRPGDFARRLDHILRISAEKAEVLDTFEKISIKVSTPVLLQVLNHFSHRNQNKNLRVFFPKGNSAKMMAIENKLPELDSGTCHQIENIITTAIISQLKEKNSLGKVYIDPALKNYTVPFAMRSASKALRTVSRGSKISLPEGDTVRMFIWWKDGKSRTDIDLSALVLNDDFSFNTVISYYNLKEFGGYHSGDITSAPVGASEFIDIEIPVFKQKGGRYLIMSINSFTNQPYCDLPECFAGFMVRQFPNSGEIYEPRTIQNKFDLSSDTEICIPLIIDLEERKVIWTDIALEKNLGTSNHVHGNLSSMSILCQAMVDINKPNLYDLFMLHGRARGEVVQDRKNADTVFSLDEGITPYDREIIIGEYL